MGLRKCGFKRPYLSPLLCPAGVFLMFYMSLNCIKGLDLNFFDFFVCLDLRAFSGAFIVLLNFNYGGVTF